MIPFTTPRLSGLRGHLSGGETARYPPVATVRADPRAAGPVENARAMPWPCVGAVLATKGLPDPPKNLYVQLLHR
jgi:hypothetical protein